MSTASIAAGVIAASGAPEPASVTSNNASTEAMAAANPDAIIDEVRSLSGEDANYTRRVAAANLSQADARPWEMTREGMVRRAQDPDASLTERAAREMIDMATAFEGREVDPADRRGLAVRRFVVENPDAQIHAGAMFDAEEGSPEWYAAIDAAVDSIIERGRNSK